MAKKKTKIPYDVRGVEDAGSDFEQAPIGLYRFKITECDYEEPDGKDPRLHVQLEITHDNKGKKVKQNYGTFHRYFNLKSEAAAGFLKSFLKAVGVVTNAKTEKGSLDISDIKGQSVLGRVRHEIWKVEDGGDGEPRAKIGNIMPLADDDDSDDDDDDDVDDEDVEDDDDDDEEEDEDDEDDEDDDDEEDDDEDDDEDDEDEEDEPDWSSMKIGELKEAVEENDGDLDDIIGKGKKAKKGAKAKAAIVEWLEENAGEDVDYNEWSLQELKDELEERELSTKGKKPVLVKRLEKADEAEAEEEPF